MTVWRVEGLVKLKGWKLMVYGADSSPDRLHGSSKCFQKKKNHWTRCPLAEIPWTLACGNAGLIPHSTAENSYLLQSFLSPWHMWVTDWTPALVLAVGGSLKGGGCWVFFVFLSMVGGQWSGKDKRPCPPTSSHHRNVQRPQLSNIIHKGIKQQDWNTDYNFQMKKLLLKFYQQKW